MCVFFFACNAVVKQMYYDACCDTVNTCGQHGGSVALSSGQLKPSVLQTAKMLETTLWIMQQLCASTSRFQHVAMYSVHVSSKSAVVKMLKNVRSKRFFPYQKRQLSYRNQTFRQEGNNCNHSWLTTQPLFSHEAFRQASITSWISRQTSSKSPRPPPRAFSRSAHRWAKLDSANCAIK